MMDTKQILQEVDLIGEALNIICQRSNFQIENRPHRRRFAP